MAKDNIFVFVSKATLGTFCQVCSKGTIKMREGGHESRLVWYLCTACRLLLHDTRPAFKIFVTHYKYLRKFVDTWY